jgi:hypothetical protein
MAVDALREVVFAQFPQCLSQIVHHKAIMLREELDTHLWDLQPGI